MTSAVDFEKILLTTLRSSTDLQAVVGNRIYCLYIPQGAKMPCVSFQRIYGRPANTLMGASGLEVIGVQIDCWGRSLTDCKNAAKAVRAVMPASGPWGAHLDQDQDLYDGETKYFRVLMEYTVWFCENAED